MIMIFLSLKEMIYDLSSLWIDYNLVSQVFSWNDKDSGTRELIEIIRFSDHINPFFF